MAILTQDQLTSLREKAEKATQGPWHAGWFCLKSFGQAVVSAKNNVSICYLATKYRGGQKHFASADKNAAFIAVANPTVVLQLLDMISELRNK